MEDNATRDEKTANAPAPPGSKAKFVMVVTTAVIAFYFAYSYAASVNTTQDGYAPTSGSPAGYAAGGTGGAGGAGGSAGGGCCGGGGGAAGGAGAYGAQGGAAGGSGGGGCCGGGSRGPAVTKSTTVAGDRQSIDMVVNGSWNPSTIKAKANLPITINLDVQQAGGCLSALVFPQLNTNVQLQSGTKSKVEIPSLKPGTYTYTCQMGMVNGQLVVE